ncbi:MAG: M23 family metallopeptidase [Treponema sp.]|jgi:murein DD-endopeptidase MepM/ murein hydrolase activator NlpD|nr:M23 family metallopeptidase [Treponema sp.]
MVYRRSIKPLVLLAALFGLFSYSTPAEDLIHLVAKGDTIYSISLLYKISQEELMRHNNIADSSKLQMGMRLAIPSRTNSPPAVIAAPATPVFFLYTVSKNDTLYSIARSRGVTLQALRDINGFSKSYVLKTGEKIKIPGHPPAAAGGKTSPKSSAHNTAKTADPSIRWPVMAKEVLYMSSNTGVLVSGRESESIKSLTGGVVVHASPWRGYGNVAVIETDEGYRYLYGSCETLSVRKGDNIEPGTELGKLGIYPASGKPDLVLIVSHNGSPVDPAKAPRF